MMRLALLYLISLVLVCLDSAIGAVNIRQYGLVLNIGSNMNSQSTCRSFTIWNSMLETYYSGSLTGYSATWYVGNAALNGGYWTQYPSDLFQFGSYMSGNVLNLCISRYNGNNWGQYLQLYANIFTYSCNDGQYINSRFCYNVLPGYYSSITPQTSQYGQGACPPGTYCPGGTGYPLACLPGYYCSSSGQAGVTGQCSPGYYCPGSAISPTQFMCAAGTASSWGYAACYACSPGYYCTAGSPSYTQNSCPLGSYCPSGLQLPCTAGYACTLLRMSVGNAFPCIAGYYCPAGSSSRTQFVCPLGSVCPAGVGSPPLCTGGSYCSSTGLSVVTGACTAGYYCPAGSTFPTVSLCSIGSYCPASAAAPTSCTAGYYCPTSGMSTPIICTAGNYCPASSSAQTPAPAGTYTPSTGYSVGTACTASYYCPVVGLTAPSTICTIGSYCPSGTSVPVPAPLGFFSPVTGLSVSRACLAGGYCGITGLTTPQFCPPGQYCAAGVSAGVSCSAGTYCPGNSSATTACTAGSYCLAGSSVPTGLCQGGYYCTAGSSTATRTVCPAQYYCPPGAGAAIYCPGENALISLYCFVFSDYCATWCPSAGLSAPVNGPCLAGKYCPSGTRASALNCTAGYFCPSAVSAQSVCTAGYYCNTTQLSAVTGACPIGTYCPAGSINPVACTGGRYCATTGLSATTGACTAANYCPVGSTSATQIPCPDGYYCPAGSVAPLICPNGSFCPPPASINTVCTAGSYCGNTSLVAVSGPCNGGWYCPAGSTSASQIICPVGKYCPSGASTPTTCPISAFCPLSSSAFTLCTPGSYCATAGLSAPTAVCSSLYYCTTGSTTPTQRQCLAGSYCPAGSAIGTPCTLGSYCIAFVSVPTVCPATKYCGSTGLSAPSGPCDGGYYCTGNASVSTQFTCQPPNYCPAGSSTQTPCTAGTFCNSTGLSAPTGNCSAGYYCPASSYNSTVFICPFKSYCPARSSTPIACVDGQYCPVGSGAPINCSAPGFTCPLFTATVPVVTTFGPLYGSGNKFVVSFTANSAAPVSQHQCQLVAVSPYLFNAGSPRPGLVSITFNNSVGGQYVCSTTQLQCPSFVSTLTGDNSTQFIVTLYWASSLSIQVCIARFAEVGSSWNNAWPSAVTIPYTVQSTTFCPSGQYMSVSGSRCQQCNAGYYGVSYGYSTPTCSATCTSSYYCPLGSTSPTQQICPAGSICPNSILTACPGGYFCNSTGLTAVTLDMACPAGIYCPGGFTSPQANVTCPRGFYCPGGGSDRIVCASSHYCPAGSSAPQLLSAVCTSNGASGRGWVCPSTSSLLSLSLGGGNQGGYSSVTVSLNTNTPNAYSTLIKNRLLSTQSSSAPAQLQACTYYSVPTTTPSVGNMSISIATGSTTVVLDSDTQTVTWQDTIAANTGIITEPNAVYYPTTSLNAQGSWVFAGCYQDKSNARLLPQLLANLSGTDLVVQCMQLARASGYTKIAVSGMNAQGQGAQCWVCSGACTNYRNGNNEVNQNYFGAGNCVISPTYVPSGMYIGSANNGSAIYEWTPTIVPSVGLRVYDWAYYGCFVDQANPRIAGAATSGWGQMRVWVNYTGADPVAACQRWAFAQSFYTVGISNGECWACQNCGGWGSAARSTGCGVTAPSLKIAGKNPWATAVYRVYGYGTAKIASNMFPSSSTVPAPGRWSYLGCFPDTGSQPRLFTLMTNDVMNSDIVLFCQNWGFQNYFNFVGLGGTTSPYCFGCNNCFNGANTAPVTGCAVNSVYSTAGPVGASAVMAVYSWTPMLAATTGPISGAPTGALSFTASFDSSSGVVSVCASRAPPQTQQTVGPSLQTLGPYSVSVANQAASTGLGAWVHAGCFMDADFRTVPFDTITNMFASNGGTVDQVGQCLAMAKSRGFNVVAVEVGTECRFCSGCTYWSLGTATCGTSKNGISSIGSVGGNWAQSVYILPVDGVWSYRGCFLDSTYHPIPVRYISLTGDSDPLTQCQRWGATMGFDTIGINNAVLCWGCKGCNFAAAGASATCATNLGTNPTQQMLGGANSLAVYSFSSTASAPVTSVAPSLPSGPGLWILHGCYIDNANRIFSNPNFYVSPAVDPVMSCQAWALSQGYNTVGIEDTNQCFGCTNCLTGSYGGDGGRCSTGQQTGGRNNFGIAVYSFIGNAVPPPVAGTFQYTGCKLSRRSPYDGFSSTSLAFATPSGMPRDIAAQCQANALAKGMGLVSFQTDSGSNGNMCSYCSDCDVTSSGESSTCSLNTQDGILSGLSYISANTASHAVYAWVPPAVSITYQPYCGAGYYSNGYSCYACAAGTYGTTSGYTSSLCSGYCGPGNWSSSGATSQSICPVQRYCVNGGQYSCTPGSFCNSTGLSAPSGLCLAGYYCPANSLQANQTVTPAGSYSLAGASAPVVCPQGYYCGSTGLTTTSGMCTPGWACPAGSSNTTAVPCAAGFYCVPNIIVANSWWSGSCTAGYYCPAGSSVITGNGTCPAGSACPGGGVAITVCPVGRWSIAGQSACSVSPVGYYAPNTGMSSPLACPAGKYCGTTTLSAPTGNCSAGYYCPINSTTATQIACAFGQWCPTQSSAPSVCPTGYFCNARTTSLQACSANCSTCVNGTNDGCTRCLTPNVLRLGSLGCGTSCAFSQYNYSQAADPNGKCIMCASAGCLCDGTTSACQSCLPGWFLAGGTCINTCESQYYLPLFGGVCLRDRNTTLDSTTTVTCSPSTVTSGQPALCTIAMRLNGVPVARTAYPYASGLNDNGAGGSFSATQTPLDQYQSYSFVYEPPVINSGQRMVTLSVGIAGVTTTLIVFSWPSAATWYLPQWAYRQSLTFDTRFDEALTTQFSPVSAAASTSLNSLVVPVLLNAQTFPFSNAQSLGQDIVFVYTPPNQPDAPQTALFHEVERWFGNASGISSDGGSLGALIWVRLPALAASLPITLQMYYGNPNALDRGKAFSRLVWSDGYYQLVMHLGSVGAQDSSPYANITQPQEFQLNTTAAQIAVAASTTLISAPAIASNNMNTAGTAGVSDMLSPALANPVLGGFGRVLNSTYFLAAYVSYPAKGNASDLSTPAPTASLPTPGSPLDLASASAFTIEAWVLSRRSKSDLRFSSQFSPSNSNGPQILDTLLAQGVVDSGQGFTWGLLMSNTSFNQSHGTNNAVAAAVSGTVPQMQLNGGAIDDSDWHWRAVTYTASTLTWQHYLDGQPLGSPVVSGIALNELPFSYSLFIGLSPTAQPALELVIDELRVSVGIARPATYFAAQYAAMTGAMSFLGPLVRSPSPASGLSNSSCSALAGACAACAPLPSSVSSSVATTIASTCLQCAPGAMFLPNSTCVTRCPAKYSSFQGIQCVPITASLTCVRDATMSGPNAGTVMVAGSNSIQCTYLIRQGTSGTPSKWGVDFTINMYDGAGAIVSGITIVRTSALLVDTQFTFTVAAAAGVSANAMLADSTGIVTPLPVILVANPSSSQITCSPPYATAQQPVLSCTFSTGSALAAPWMLASSSAMHNAFSNTSGLIAPPSANTGAIALTSFVPSTSAATSFAFTAVASAAALSSPGAYYINVFYSQPFSNVVSLVAQFYLPVYAGSFAGASPDVNANTAMGSNYTFFVFPSQSATVLSSQFSDNSAGGEFFVLSPSTSVRAAAVIYSPPPLPFSGPVSITDGVGGFSRNLRVAGTPSINSTLSCPITITAGATYTCTYTVLNSSALPVYALASSLTLLTDGNALGTFATPYPDFGTSFTIIYTANVSLSPAVGHVTLSIGPDSNTLVTYRGAITGQPSISLSTLKCAQPDHAGTMTPAGTSVACSVSLIGSDGQPVNIVSSNLLLSDTLGALGLIDNITTANSGDLATGVYIGTQAALLNVSQPASVFNFTYYTSASAPAAVNLTAVVSSVISTYQLAVTSLNLYLAADSSSTIFCDSTVFSVGSSVRCVLNALNQSNVVNVPSDSFNASVSNADGSIVLPVPLIGSSGIGASAFVASSFNMNVSWSNGTGGPVQLNVNYSNGFSVTTTLQVNSTPDASSQWYCSQQYALSLSNISCTFVPQNGGFSIWSRREQFAMSSTQIQPPSGASVGIFGACNPPDFGSSFTCSLSVGYGTGVFTLSSGVSGVAPYTMYVYGTPDGTSSTSACAGQAAFP